LNIDHDIRLRLCAQRALLTHIVPQLRAVSLDIVPDERRLGIRFVFDGDPSEPVRNAASCAATEVLSDYPDWEVAEEYVTTPAPLRIEHLRLLVYARCEDEWVTGRT
jgi:hypothetical protein